MSKKSNKTSNKKLLLIAIITLAAIAIFGFVLYKILGGAGKKVEIEDSIVLDAEYKNTDGQPIDISKKEDPVSFLAELTAKKKNFVVYVSLPVCNSDQARKFREYVLEFQHKNKITFYHLTSDYSKETGIYDTVKFFPSVLVYKDGKIISFLRYDSDEDLEYYKSYDGFSKWLKKHVEF
ncbi:hypothetical protein J6W91_03185 [Candidatus Saccharibacteria bacterium]|nr:hypothetical protein [Candidatus Saccharibacteria bacterium]